MRRILVNIPYLDCGFKQSAGTTRTGVVPEIRKHWDNVFTGIRLAHQLNDDIVEVREDYLWKLCDDLDSFKDYDAVYIPHKNRVQLGYHNTNARYVMQTVFPHLFTIDHKGWGGTHSAYFNFEELCEQWNQHTLGGGMYVFDEYRKRIAVNVSKFSQPKTEWEPPKGDYILFPCQLPHDETIKYHSPNWTVQEALDNILRMTHGTNIRVVVKGHPANPGSMAPLKTICEQWNHAIWVEDVSIHKLLADCWGVVTVNSGVGVEAILHDKPIMTYGQSEYDWLTLKHEDIGHVRDVFNYFHRHRDNPSLNYFKFMDFFVNRVCVDARHVNIDYLEWGL